MPSISHPARGCLENARRILDDLSHLNHPVSLCRHEQHIDGSAHFEILARGGELAGFGVHLEHHNVVAVLVARNQVISTRIEIETSRRLAWCGSVLSGREGARFGVHSEDSNTIRAAVGTG